MKTRMHQWPAFSSDAVDLFLQLDLLSMAFPGVPRLNFSEGAVHKSSLAPLDWDNSKNGKLLRMANHREVFKFQKLKQALGSMENVHKSYWRCEERATRESLKRLIKLSHTYQSHTAIRGESSDRVKVTAVGGRMCLSPGQPSQGEQASSPHAPSSMPVLSPPRSLRGCISPLHCTADGTLSSHFPDITSSSSSTRTPPAGLSCRPSQYPSSMNLAPEGPSTSALTPSLTHKLHSHPQPVLGFGTLQKRVAELMAHTRSADQLRQSQCSATLCPLEALHCRYLRLSESNIITLLQLCRENGVHVDIHPHMKDSDIDIISLFKSSPAQAPNSHIQSDQPIKH